MSVDESPPPRLRPLGFGEILDVAFKICTGKAATLLKAVCVTVIPLQLLAAVVVISTIGEDVYSSSLEFDTSSSSDEIDVDWTEIAGFAVLLLLGGLTYLLSTAACFRAIAQAYLGRPVDWRASVTFAFERLGPLTWVTLLVVLLFVPAVVVVLLGFLASIGLGILLLIAALAGAVWLSIALAFAYPALFVEDTRGVAALKRSFQLVRGTWWRVFGILFVGYLIASILAGIVQFAIALPVLVAVDEDTVAGVALNVTSTVVGQLISTPLVSAMLAVVYFDQRVRREGFDLELLARQIGEHGAAVAPSPAIPEGYVPQPSPFAAPPDPHASPPPAGVPAWPAPPHNQPPANQAPPPQATFVERPPPPGAPPPPTFLPPGAEPPPARRPGDELPPSDSGFLPPRPPELGDDR